MKTQQKSKCKRSKSKNPFKKTWNGVPATVRPSLFEKSLAESFFTSAFWHLIVALLIWAITFLLLFFGIAPKLFPQPKPKMNDIEFIMNNHHSRHRSRNTKTKLKPVNETVTQIPEKQEVVPNVLPTQSRKNTKKLTGETKSEPSKNAVIPDFSASIPNLSSMSSGLGTSSKKSRSSSSRTPDSSIGDINNAFSTNGSAGTSSGFNKNAAKNIVTTYDISPYVNELKRNIRWNWKAPAGSENKRVELFLRIAKDGRLIILNVKRTSENGDVDNAALNAVKRCLPLNPLPSKYRKSYLDVIFTFGSNSVGSRY